MSSPTEHFDDASFELPKPLHDDFDVERNTEHLNRKQYVVIVTDKHKYPVSRAGLCRFSMVAQEIFLGKQQAQKKSSDNEQEDGAAVEDILAPINLKGLRPNEEAAIPHLILWVDRNATLPAEKLSHIDPGLPPATIPTEEVFTNQWDLKYLETVLMPPGTTDIKLLYELTDRYTAWMVKRELHESQLVQELMAEDLDAKKEDNNARQNAKSRIEELSDDDDEAEVKRKKAKEVEEPVDAGDVPEADILCIMAQIGHTCSRNAAIKALQKNNREIISSLKYLYELGY